MDDELDRPRVQADNQSIAIGEINISGNVTGTIKIGHTIIQAADARLRHDLSILLKNVETTWIKGVLEKSVHEAALLELGMEIHAEAVDNPWRMVMEKPDQSQEVIPQGRKIKDIFDEANRLLLILGEPGSGKTTTLLQLARDLITEVDEAFTQPIPVILNLSTWTNKQQPLDEWLIAELNSKYRLPKKDGKRWLSEHRILPLLDGLDEVRAENRAACVEKINQLVTDYGLQGAVVCSRIKDYTALDVRLAFYRAIYIQPLTPEQVDEYLNQAGEKLASLRSALQNDEALRSMAQSPLIMNVMSLAYQNISAEELRDPALVTNEARRKQLFGTYITRMFHRKGGARLYDDEQTKQRLSWLARNMQRHNQEVFLVENLQPSWLTIPRWQWVYALASRMNAWLTGGPIFGLIVALIVGLSDGSSNGLIVELIDGLIVGLIFGLIHGPIVGLIDLLRFEWLRKRTSTRKSHGFWWLITNIVIVWLINGLVFGLIAALIVGLSDGLIVGLINGLTNGLIFGLIVGLIFGPRGSKQSLENDIQAVEALRWSWHRARAGLIVGLIVGVIVGLIFGLIGGLILGLSSVLVKGLINGLMVGLLSGLILGPMVGLIGGLMGGPINAILNGWKGEIIETKSFPNQGIWLSMRNAILGGLIGGLIGGVIVGLILGLIVGRSSGLIVGLTVWLSSGLIGALIGVMWYGGLDVIQHYTLRLFLVIQGHTPRNYARFLDYGVDRIFLQKVGGGYRFIHRLLLEHFAEMDTTTKKV